MKSKVDRKGANETLSFLFDLSASSVRVVWNCRERSPGRPVLGGAALASSQPLEQDQILGRRVVARFLHLAEFHGLQKGGPIQL